MGMANLNYKELPLKQLISFNKLLQRYEVMAQSDNEYLAKKARRILEAQEPYPELREGFTDVKLLEKNKDLIHFLLQDLFSEVLAENEIKTASLPYDNTIFNSSKRFQKIIEEAGQGSDFVPEMRNMPDDQMYVMACTVILTFYYGLPLDFKRPFFYDIPDANGVMRHYRILYNADFIELLPTEKAKKLSQTDVEELLDNFDNIDLWKEKIPPNSFVSKGFVISNMFDVTVEHSISELKSSLIASDKRDSEGFVDNLQATFQSFFNKASIRAGFMTFNAKTDSFEPVYGAGMDSFVLGNMDVKNCNEILCPDSYKKLLRDNTYFAISDVDRYAEQSEAPLYKNLQQQGIKSAVFAPIADKDNLLGVLELVSTEKNALNSVNANKLQDVMPFIVSAVLRSKAEEENLIDAVIQHECTSVHEAVYWRFQEEAKRFIKEDLEGAQPTFREIVFKDVHPLYGQIDIKNSSDARNVAIQRDLMIQLSTVNKVLEAAWVKNKLPIYEELMFRVNDHMDSIKESLNTNSEQAIFNFVADEIHPVFSHLKKSDSEIANLISSYESSIDMGTDSYYDHRRNYDESVMLINKKLAALIDKKQQNAQAMFPHYFERYKTDGVEHNIYIGDSISGDLPYNPIYLNNLRLWQLQVMCEMENAHYKLKPELPVPLDVASLVLVYNTSLSIRFRMDEKRFDVDGTYNARYEVIKKRIDKSYIKGTNERLTQPGKMVIVYSQKKDELEYLRYVKFLKSKGYFSGKVEIVELEGLQGVSGLKAIRADILYKTADKANKDTYTYEDLMEELKS